MPSISSGATVIGCLTESAVVTTGGTDFRALTRRGAIGEEAVMVPFCLVSSPETRCEDGGEKALSKGFGMGFSGDHPGVLRGPGVNRLGEDNGGRWLIGGPLSSVAENTEEGRPLATFKVWKGVTLEGKRKLCLLASARTLGTHCLTPCSRAIMDCAIALAC